MYYDFKIRHHLELFIFCKLMFRFFELFFSCFSRFDICPANFDSCDHINEGNQHHKGIAVLFYPVMKEPKN